MGNDETAWMAAAARAMQSEQTEQDTLDQVLSLAMEMVGDAEHAGITVLRHGRVESVATSDEVIERLDRLQDQLSQGPCVDAIKDQELVYSSDVGTDPRWPDWGPKISADEGVHSMMCFRLFTSEDVVGALNLHSSRQGAFTAEDRDHSTALAAHAAIAVLAARHADHMAVALDTRTITAQATGILMERFDLTADRAFEVLRRVSSQSNRKLSLVAQELVLTRDLPR